MDTVVTDVVSQSATKFSLDKKFLVGVAVGAAAVGTALAVSKLKEKFGKDKDDEAVDSE